MKEKMRANLPACVRCASSTMTMMLARSFSLPIRDMASGSYQRPSAGGSDAPVAILAWHGVVLAEITNFAGLRRHLGRPRADRLVLDLFDRASDHVPGIRSVGAGRTIAEFEIGATDLATIEAMVELLRTAFDSPFDLDGELHRVEIVLAAAAAPVGSTEDVRLVEEAEGALEQARIEDTDWYWPAGERLAGAEVDDRVRLLAPFDPIVWDRRRFEQLWNWAYRFEAYTPVAKRKIGYYALPMLWRDQVIGWANVAVRNGGLIVDAGYVSGSAPRDRRFARELDTELDRLRTFLQL